MRSRVNTAKFFTNRWAIVIYNLIIFMIALSAILQSIPLLKNTVNDFSVIEGILDGIGLIFVTYGVALEERETVMKFFKVYPEYFNRLEEKTDNFCHLYGLWFLLIGLFMEVAVELVKLPNTIFNTAGIEIQVFAIGLISCSLAAWFLLRLSFFLVRIQFKHKRHLKMKLSKKHRRAGVRVKG